MKEQYYRMTLSDAIAQYGCKFGVIYRIYCDQTGCSYVGQTRDINKNQRLSRIKSHYNALKKNCHPSSKLQAAWDARGGESIKDEILEVIAPVNKNGTDSNEKMAQAEKRWQEVYGCNQNSGVPVDRYYALKAGELKKLRDAGIINNATFVYFILKLKNPWCDRPLRIKPLELSIEWDIPESSVYEAIGKLKDAELINIEEAEIVLKWNSQEDSLSDNPELLRDSRMDSEIPECVMENQNGFRDSRMDSEIPENRKAQPAPDKVSTISHTLQTYSDFKKTLSDSEREEFLKFGENRAGELKNPPVQLPQKWIEKNWEELSGQWFKTRDKNQKYNFAAYSEPQHQMWYQQLQDVVYGTIQSGDSARLEQFLKDDFYSNWLNWAKTAREDVREFLASNPIPTENPVKAE